MSKLRLDELVEAYQDLTLALERAKRADAVGVGGARINLDRLIEELSLQRDRLVRRIGTELNYAGETERIRVEQILCP